MIDTPELTCQSYAAPNPSASTTDSTGYDKLVLLRSHLVFTSLKHVVRGKKIWTLKRSFHAHAQDDTFNLCVFYLLLQCF